jgi:hypothetical protein
MRFLGLGVQLAVSVAVLAALGSWADRRIGTNGILTIVGALVGFVGTMLSLIRQLSRKDGP